MFDKHYMDGRSYNKTIVSSHVNAVTGNITKTYRDSFFKKSAIGDGFLFDDKPTVSRDIDNYRTERQAVVVIQMVIVGDMKCVVELMWKEDYDKIFEEKKGD